MKHAPNTPQRHFHVMHLRKELNDVSHMPYKIYIRDGRVDMTLLYIISSIILKGFLVSKSQHVILFVTQIYTNLNKIIHFSG